jgi:hypothetical protein
MLISTSSICSSLIGINEEMTAATASSTGGGHHSFLTRNSGNKIANSISSTSCCNHSNSVAKPTRTSSSSLSLNGAAAITTTPNTAGGVQFKMPSNLPPVENGEVITIDIETYRMLVQEIQDTKIILHKLAQVLREQPAMVLNTSGEEEDGEDGEESAFGNQHLAEDPFSHISSLLKVRIVFLFARSVSKIELA